MYPLLHPRGERGNLYRGGILLLAFQSGHDPMQPERLHREIGVRQDSDILSLPLDSGSGRLGDADVLTRISSESSRIMWTGQEKDKTQSLPVSMFPEASDVSRADRIDDDAGHDRPRPGGGRVRRQWVCLWMSVSADCNCSMKPRPVPLWCSSRAAACTSCRKIFYWKELRVELAWEEKWA